MTHCDDCPIRAAGKTCPAVSRNVAAYCQLRRKDPATWDLALAEMAGAEPPNRVAESLAAVRACPHRGEVVTRRDGCQQELRRCALKLGPWPDNPEACCLADCLACVSRPNSPARTGRP